MFTPLGFCLRAGVFLGAAVLFSHSAAAQTPHCFNNLNGPEVPCTPRNSGSGYSAPAYRGPSPAQIAKRRRIKAGNAANERGAAALKRSDYATAVREFEQAMRLWPEDRNVHGNYWFAKGILNFTKWDFASALEDYKESLRYQSDPKSRQTIIRKISEMKMNLGVQKASNAEDAGDWDSAILHWNDVYPSCVKAGLSICNLWTIYSHIALSGKALSQQNWAIAARELDRYYSDMIANERKLNPHGQKTERLAAAFDVAREANRALANGNLETALLGYERAQKMERNHDLTPTRHNSIAAEIRHQIARQQEARKSEEKRKEKASNPNYPNPPPVYRDASTPRSYPDFTSFTPTQHQAHADNESGNLWAQKGDWVQALLSYQKALTEETSGPFAEVLKENLAIAMKHLGPQKANAVPASAAPGGIAASPAAKEEKPKEVVQANCTGWMKQANGASFRLCMDERAQRYCEQSAQSDGKGAISRVSCQ